MPVSVFITTGWRKNGVREAIVESLPEKKTVITVVLKGRVTKVFGMDWFRTYEDAEERAHALRAKEILLFQKRIKNLQSLPLCRGITINPREPAKVVGLRAKHAKLLRVVAKMEREGVPTIVAAMARAMGEPKDSNTLRMARVLMNRGMLTMDPDKTYHATAQGMTLIPKVDL